MSVSLGLCPGLCQAYLPMSVSLGLSLGPSQTYLPMSVSLGLCLGLCQAYLPMSVSLGLCPGLCQTYLQNTAVYGLTSYWTARLACPDAIASRQVVYSHRGIRFFEAIAAIGEAWSTPDKTERGRRIPAAAPSSTKPKRSVIHQLSACCRRAHSRLPGCSDLPRHRNRASALRTASRRYRP